MRVRFKEIFDTAPRSGHGGSRLGNSAADRNWGWTSASSGDLRALEDGHPELLRWAYTSAADEGINNKPDHHQRAYG